MNYRNTTLPNRASGITLVELMVVVVMVSILMSIAVPSYRNYILKANRVDAKTSLLRLASAQEKHYLQNNTYTGNLTGATTDAPPGLAMDDISTYQHFTIAIIEADATGFTATATAREGQIADEECTLFAMNEVGQKFGGVAPISEATNEPECWGNR